MQSTRAILTALESKSPVVVRQALDQIPAFVLFHREELEGIFNALYEQSIISEGAILTNIITCIRKVTVSFSDDHEYYDKILPIVLKILFSCTSHPSNEVILHSVNAIRSLICFSPQLVFDTMRIFLDNYQTSDETLSNPKLSALALLPYFYPMLAATPSIVENTITVLMTDILAEVTYQEGIAALTDGIVTLCEQYSTVSILDTGKYFANVCERFQREAVDLEPVPAIKNRTKFGDFRLSYTTQERIDYILYLRQHISFQPMVNVLVRCACEINNVSVTTQCLQSLCAICTISSQFMPDMVNVINRTLGSGAAKGGAILKDTIIEHLVYLLVSITVFLTPEYERALANAARQGLTPAGGPVDAPDAGAGASAGANTIVGGPRHPLDYSVKHVVDAFLMVLVLLVDTYCTGDKGADSAADKREMVSANLVLQIIRILGTIHLFERYVDFNLLSVEFVGSCLDLINQTTVLISTVPAQVVLQIISSLCDFSSSILVSNCSLITNLQGAQINKQTKGMLVEVVLLLEGVIHLLGRVDKDLIATHVLPIILCLSINPNFSPSRFAAFHLFEACRAQIPVDVCLLVRHGVCDPSWRVRDEVWCILARSSMLQLIQSTDLQSTMMLNPLLNSTRTIVNRDYLASIRPSFLLWVTDTVYEIRRKALAFLGALHTDAFVTQPVRIFSEPSGAKSVEGLRGRDIDPEKAAIRAAVSVYLLPTTERLLAGTKCYHRITGVQVAMFCFRVLTAYAAIVREHFLTQRETIDRSTWTAEVAHCGAEVDRVLSMLLIIVRTDCRVVQLALARAVAGCAADERLAEVVASLRGNAALCPEVRRLLM